MPRQETYEEKCFELWLKGKTIKQMWEEVGRKIRLGSVRGWVKDWERRRQKAWDPHAQFETPTGTRRHNKCSE